MAHPKHKISSTRRDKRRTHYKAERARCWIAARSFVPQTITNQRLKLC